MAETLEQEVEEQQVESTPVETTESPLEQKFKEFEAENKPSAPVEGEVAPEGDEPAESAEATRQPEGLKRYQELQQKAKELGIDPRGMKAADIEAAIAKPAEPARSDVWDRAKRDYGFSDADRERFQSEEELEEVLFRLDRRKIAEANRQRQQQQRQPQQPPQQQQQQAPIEPDWAALEEEYGEDHPLLQTLKMQHQMVQAQQQTVQQMRAAQMQRAQQGQHQSYQKFQEDFIHATDEFVDEVGLTGRFGKGAFMQRAPDQQMQTQEFFRAVEREVRAAPQLLQRYTMKQLVSMLGREWFKPQVQQQVHRKESARSNSQKKAVLGDPSNRRQTVGDTKVVPGMLHNDRLKQVWNEYVAANGSDDYVE